MSNVIIGIDPGAQGAAVFLKNGVLDKFIRFKILPWEVAATGFWRVEGEAFIEAVSAMPRDAKSNAFTFGENTGIIKGILYANQIDFQEIASQKWQRHFKLGAKFESKTARKNAQKDLAQKLFPQVKVTLDLADALLIARYGYEVSLHDR